ncbi:acyl-CoA thioesterase FadM [Dyadobacter jejuensis]|uniref:Acyl-CoA thioesterase FadM n=1 Tax=Dyadobacter jejuensis TaxID=1082580 RepID=A0A316ADP1_9BACT|nr:thioesterase family protein [Dyadobacter jejuensis]PWJ54994.1 acyl-CoA thioesterase FadM [Dyadobacter jejuensis]
MLSFVKEKDRFDFSMPLDINWSLLFSLNYAKEEAFGRLMKQGRLFYLIRKFKGKWKQMAFFEQETRLEVHHPLQFPEPARIFVRITEVEEKGFTMECMILSLINNVETVLSIAKTKMLLCDYEGNRVESLQEELQLCH